MFRKWQINLDGMFRTWYIPRQLTDESAQTGEDLPKISGLGKPSDTSTNDEGATDAKE
jgi:hypothetical protein